MNWINIVFLVIATLLGWSFLRTGRPTGAAHDEQAIKMRAGAKAYIIHKRREMFDHLRPCAI
jgi:hypothetical protein